MCQDRKAAYFILSSSRRVRSHCLQFSVLNIVKWCGNKSLLMREREMCIILTALNPQTFDAGYEVCGLSSLSHLSWWLILPDKSAKVKDLTKDRDVNQHTAHTQPNNEIRRFVRFPFIFYPFGFSGAEESRRDFFSHKFGSGYSYTLKTDHSAYGKF